MIHLLSRLLATKKVLFGLVFWTATIFTGWGQAPEDSPGDDVVGIIRMSDLGTNEVLETLEKFTGKPMLRQQNLPAVKINFNSQGPMTRDEAILAIESLLSINGIAITEVGDRFLKAVPSASISTQVPRLLADPASTNLPSQSIFSKFYRLDYLTPQEAIPLLQPLMSLGAPVAFEKSNSLLLTDALVNLQRIETVLEQVDRPSDVDVEILFFDLKHIVASEIARRLQTLQGTSLKRFLENNTTFEGDDRTNQLIVFTHPSNKQLITDLIEKFDIDVAPLTRTDVFLINYADATEITTLIEQVITGQKQSRQEASGRGSTTTRSRAGSGQQPNQKAATDVAKTLSEAGAKNLQFSDFLTIVADPRGNAIVASGTPNDLLYLEELIGKIDTLLAQVRIEVIIAEVTLNRDQARGIDIFNIDYNLNDSNEINYRLDGASTSRLSQSLSLQGTVKELSIAAIFDTARRDSRVSVLSAPTIVTTHNQEAVISVGESRPVITSSQSDLSGGSFSRSTIQFRDIGINLTVKPLIGSDGVIQLEIDQIVESVVGTVTIDANEQPIIGKRQATSFVSVADGEFVILGGLQESSFTGARNRKVLLGSIPILGDILFGSRSKEATKRELIIFIKPNVIHNSIGARTDAKDALENITSKEELETYFETGTFSEKEEFRKLKRLKKLNEF